MSANFDDVLIKMLGKVQLFRNFGRQELIDLVLLGRKVVFKPGETVFLEGERGECMYLVLSGSFDVTKKTITGRSKRLAIVEAGEHFGEMAVIESHERTATVSAITPSVTLKFNQEVLLQHPETSVKIYQNIARLLSKRLRKTNEVLVLKSFN